MRERENIYIKRAKERLCVISRESRGREEKDMIQKSAVGQEMNWHKTLLCGKDI